MTKTLATNLLAAICCYLLGTASALAKPDEASLSEVANCHFLKTVDGTSGYGKVVAWKPLAKANAEKRAGEIGATHIVWTHFRSTGAFTGAVSARAYACDR